MIGPKGKVLQLKTCRGRCRGKLHCTFPQHSRTLASTDSGVVHLETLRYICGAWLHIEMMDHTCGVQLTPDTASRSSTAACKLLKTSPNRPMKARTSTFEPLPAKHTASCQLGPL